MNGATQLLMIRPVCFSFNAQTAPNNHFQQMPEEGKDVQKMALEEFDAMAGLLETRGVPLLVIQDTVTPETPDSIFPNNWFSSHADGTLVLYPMFAPNRRAERKEAVVKRILEATGACRIIDLTYWEKEGKYLESTGSMVLDRNARIAYACLSPRTSPEVLQDFCRKMDFTPVPFHAVDRCGKPIYHTNVMMALGRSFAVLCKEAFTSEAELSAVTGSLSTHGKTIVEISLEQMEHFAGNMLEVQNDRGECLLLMSQSAFDALREDQRADLSREATLVPIPIPHIESVGGGSVRCMLAELFSR